MNLPAILSANLCIGGFWDCTDSIRFTNFAKEVSDPILITFKRKLEFKFKEPLRSWSPSLASKGFDSPVICDTSIRELPFTTWQSAGTLSPANKWISSPIFNVLTLTSFVVFWFVNFSALSGCKSNNSPIEGF